MKTVATLGIGIAVALAPVAASAQLYPGKRPTFLEIFPEDQMTCGKVGWRFPGLIRGDQPITACILKYRNNAGRSPFGPL